MINASILGIIGEDAGLQYLKNAKIKIIKKNGVFDVYTKNGVIDIKTKILPSKDPYRFEFTPNQIKELREKHFKSKKYALVLVVLMQREDYSFKYIILDMKTDFDDILIKPFKIEHRKGHGDKRLKFSVKQTERVW